MACNDKYKSSDVANIVFASIVLVLAIILFALTGKYSKEVLSIPLVYYVNFANAGWILLCGIVSLAAAVTTNQGAYACSIAMYVIGILDIIGSIAVTILAVFFNIGIELGGGSAIQVLQDSSILAGTSFYLESNTMPIALVAVNGLGFLLMIIGSCVVCCSTCCGVRRPINAPSQQGATVIMSHTSPAYVPMPPPNQQYAMYAYDQD